MLSLRPSFSTISRPTLACAYNTCAHFALTRETPCLRAAMNWPG
ncbi:hypothetical protein HMPREF0293_0962 [Corynebacterium glucuronolyticum ATCC 51866]|uniref:Uncharacterized protein n=1 Tax=Corynebacterium glucuronolyticum ATCC 51866 TaxID=548478 RepID=A0ABM9XR04_9CORY|nr:hypothetical protein HMPREF0293_0962 [Corynebacterium glucuronolyticum ATCC 51866]